MLNIATLTINPAIDIAYSVPRLAPTDKLRAPAQTIDPGGGGINVARVFVRMGGNARCVYLTGGAAGIAFDALLDLHQLVRMPVAIEGETRISATILEEASGSEYRVVPAGPEVSEAEWRACLDRIGELRCDYLVMSGSLPRGVPADFYARAAGAARLQGMLSVLDSSGDALKEAVEAGGLELIKPNLLEFQQLTGETSERREDIGKAAQELVRAGKVRLVAVTMGHAGGILASEDAIVSLSAPRAETISAVGAGDSCLAAMVHALALGKSDEDAFAMGIAAGTAALQSAGTGLAAVADIERFYTQLRENA